MNERSFSYCLGLRTYKIDLIEERYIRVAELRGVNTDHEFFQIFGNPFKMKFVESGEDGAKGLLQALSLIETVVYRTFLLDDAFRKGQAIQRERWDSVGEGPCSGLFR